MNELTNHALQLSGNKAAPVATVVSQRNSSLPRQGDTLVRIAYSSLNYKDGLAVTGHGPIIRSGLPFVPGIDLVGEVVETNSMHYFPGDWVIGTGWGIGEVHWGGYSQFQWLSSDWLVPLPESMSPLQAMVAGTAGLTAMIAVDSLQHQGLPAGSGPIVVSGASGGVGSFSVAILSTLGHEVVASTGKASSHEYLRSLGATEIVDRGVLSGGSKHPLESAKWSAAIDTVGANTLQTIIAQLRRHASVAVCGMAGGSTLETTVFPFILRGANVLGVDSNTCPNNRRHILWERLSEIMNRHNWVAVEKIIPLIDVPSYADEIVNGRVQGRIVVDVNA